MMECRFFPSFQISGRMYNTVVWNKCMMLKVCRSPTLCRYWKTIIVCKWLKQGSRSSFRPLTGWGLHQFVWKFRQAQLKARPIECYHCQPASFFIGQFLYRYTSVRIFLASILNTVLIHSYLCINTKVLQKKFFDWALIGEDTIVLRTLSIRGTKNFQQAR